MPVRLPNRVFISYARQDRNWLERLEEHLGPLQHEKIIEPWIDTGKIDYGDRYNEAIEEAIDTSSAAVLLVTPSFQNSVFIKAKELPRLLRYADAGELKLYWVLVSDCVLADTLAASYECANRSKDALDGMTSSQVNRILANVARDLQRLIEQGKQKKAIEPTERGEAEARAKGDRQLENAGRERPFINTLGMKFVPVPGTDILMSTWETRVKDYANFAEEVSGLDGSWKNVETTGHKQALDHPVVNVSWNDAHAFCAWLSERERKIYRLPTDHEWSQAVGIGEREDPKATPKEKDMKIQDVYPWGTQWPPPEGAGNYSGDESASEFGKIDGYRDVHPFTAPVGRYTPNGLGHYDLGGNVWEWCEDCFDGISGSRVLRGASWVDSSPAILLSSCRSASAPNYRGNIIGFRVVVSTATETF